jgi:small-conductance mechanosensitive channel
MLCCSASSNCCSAQSADDAARDPADAAKTAETPLAPPERVDVRPEAQDVEIRTRLTSILEATGWYFRPDVSVRDGVVFLSGFTRDPEYTRWAGDLARNTEGVAAVVNQIELQPGNAWDFTEVRAELVTLLHGAVSSLPFCALGLLVLLLAWTLAHLVRGLLRRVLRRRITSTLLREVAARSLAFLVFLLGLYFVLRVSGLTRLAVSVIGGTGIVGLVLGIAFRDITENFLASMFLSLQQPFRMGDLIEVAGTTGYVQRLNSRTTVLMTLSGNQVQVPNATVFKSTIRNYTSSPNRREEFLIGIGYDDRIEHAQDVALRILADHPAVLKDPEPWVLVDGLGSSSVNLRVYFWLDGIQHNSLKVRSSVIRLVKRAFQDADISLPDEAREIIFPEGVPVRRIDRAAEPARREQPSRRRTTETEAVSTNAEAGLKTDAHELNEQAERAWSPDGDENLLSNGDRPIKRPTN